MRTVQRNVRLLASLTEMAARKMPTQVLRWRINLTQVVLALSFPVQDT